MLSFIEIGPLVLEKVWVFFNFGVFLVFGYYMYLPLEKGLPLYLNKLESPPPPLPQE
jgi:hypothetical protein